MDDGKRQNALLILFINMRNITDRFIDQMTFVTSVDISIDAHTDVGCNNTIRSYNTIYLIYYNMFCAKKKNKTNRRDIIIL